MNCFLFIYQKIKTNSFVIQNKNQEKFIQTSFALSFPLILGRKNSFRKFFVCSKYQQGIRMSLERDMHSNRLSFGMLVFLLLTHLIIMVCTHIHKGKLAIGHDWCKRYLLHMNNFCCTFFINNYDINATA